MNQPTRPPFPSVRVARAILEEIEDHDEWTYCPLCDDTDQLTILEPREPA